MVKVSIITAANDILNFIIIFFVSEKIRLDISFKSTSRHFFF